MMYKIEVKIEGVWYIVDTAESLADAMTFASIFCETRTEEQVRIRNPEGKIL